MAKRLVDPSRAAAYCALVPSISNIAREFGYAVGVHGSMHSDLDLMLVAWTEEATPPEDVIQAIMAFVGGSKRKMDMGPLQRPHGRMSWTIYLNQEDVDFHGTNGPYLDISVIPPRS
jgi:hypothetical protein